MTQRKRPTLHGNELSDAQLAHLKIQIESFNTIEDIGDDMRELIETEWPDLASKLPPKRGERAQ